MPNMEVRFVPRGEGWRKPGRPPRKVPPELLEMLRRTMADGSQGVIPITGAPPEEIAEVVAVLKRGALDLAVKLRYQTNDESILFFVEGLPDE